MRGADNRDDQPEPWQQALRLAVHNMGTPLSAIRVLVEVLRLTPEDPEKKAELIRMLDSQVEEIAESLQTLVTYLHPVEGDSLFTADSSTNPSEVRDPPAWQDAH